ncbi:MAG TPA: IS701 family transposase [Gammaproteobacteria bacterium]|nr:IS701 family transposase [Gammaproteobacteria bacterium]
MEHTPRFTDPALRQRFVDYVTAVLPDLGRTDRQPWAEAYVRGLLLEGERKSIEPMAKRLPDGNVQALQHFIGKSPWPSEPVRRRLASVLVPEMGPGLWIVDETSFPKQGKHSVGVARQYAGTLGKVANCQVAVSLHHATATASLPVDWALFLPEEWTKDPDRCAAAGVPAAVPHEPKWRLALDLIDRARTWGLPGQRVIADAGYGTIAEFRAELQARQLPYAVGVESGTGVWMRRPHCRRRPDTGRGRPPTRWDYGGRRPRRVAEVARALPATAYQTVTWRGGSKGNLTSRFARRRVWPSHGYHAGKLPADEQWLLIEWPAKAAEPTKYWLITGPRRLSVVQLVRWAKARWWVEQDYAQLKEELGLDHFEGRRWLGWHHHVTMTTMAYGFLVRERLRRRGGGKKNGARPHAPAGSRGTPVPPENLDRVLHRMRPTHPPVAQK